MDGTGSKSWRRICRHGQAHRNEGSQLGALSCGQEGRGMQLYSPPTPIASSLPSCPDGRGGRAAAEVLATCRTAKMLAVPLGSRPSRASPSFIPSAQRCAPESREWWRQPRRLSLSGVSNGLWSEPLAQQLRHQRRSWACTACKHHAGAGTSMGPQVSPSWIFAANGGFSTSACCFDVSSELPSSRRPDVCCRPLPGADWAHMCTDVGLYIRGEIVRDLPAGVLFWVCSQQRLPGIGVRLGC